MAGRLLVDLGADGMVRVTVLNGELPSYAAPAELSWPLDGDALEDLRWYLEDYLTAPFGVYEDRGGRIAADMDGWGHKLFSSVFGSGPARDAYIGMRTRGDVELVFRSDSSPLLGLPWELMADPGRDTPLALDLAGVSRSLLVSPDAAQAVPVPDGRLRVLMVISRPSGGRDVGYQMIARPLLERLEAVRGQVDLVVLRPPTLDALARELKRAANAGTPYQVVHFDGHGAAGGSPLTFAGAGREGVLAFEKPGGGEDPVPASVIAQVLTAAKVPVVVLNACQSGAVGKELEAAVATRLLREGVASVVAMAYTVYAVAAAEFMAAFYEQLFAGGTVSSAVTAGRRQMHRNPGRPSPKGDLPLRDWLVPVNYLRRDVSFPQAVVPRPAGLPTLAAALADISMPNATSTTDPLHPLGGVFIGRDALFYDLEAAARLQKVVVLTGPGGTGKTELAKAFGRWWRDTGGVDDPRLVQWHSFEPGAASFGLEGVVNEIGRAVFGTDFDRAEPPQRLAAVKQLLAQYRSLLIWDNFESVRELPDPTGATPPLDEAESAALRDFLAWVRDHSASAVLITSRTRESWLGGSSEIGRIAVGGLTRSEAAQYATRLLAPFPAAQSKREPKSFGELLEWLDGHPLSMRLTLPRLATADAATLLAGLRSTIPAADADVGQGRLSSLGASITYSFTHLTEQARRLLPAVSLFHGIAEKNTLMLFSAAEGVPGRFADASREQWTAVLEDATRVGLLTSLGYGMYQLHPALPGYLAADWRAEDPDGYAAERDAAEQALRTACAAFSRWLTGQIESGDAALAYAVTGLQRRTLGAMLGHALDHHAWKDAEGIVRALDYHWDSRGLGAEAAAWADRILDTTANDGQAPTEAARSLWLYTTIGQANRQKGAGHPDQAAQNYLRTLAYLEYQPETDWTRQNIAVVYHLLGYTSYDRGRLDEADDWYRKSLTISQDLGNQPGIARTYHQLGMTAQGRGRLEEADDWYRKSLTISEDLGDRPAQAITYQQLGRTAQDRGRLGEADDWYRKSLTIKEDLGDRTGMADSYHQLGTTAQERGRLEEADDWYRKSLTIREKLGDRPGMARTYHQLGNTAYLRGRLGEADDWYRKSLTIKEGLDDRRGMATSYAQLGVLAEKRNQLTLALEWFVRAVTLFDEFPSPLTRRMADDLARLTRQLGVPVLQDAWRNVTGQDVPQAVLDYVSAYRDDDQPGS